MNNQLYTSIDFLDYYLKAQEYEKIMNYYDYLQQFGGYFHYLLPDNYTTPSSSASYCSDQSISPPSFQELYQPQLEIVTKKPSTKKATKNNIKRVFKCNHCSRPFARKHDSERHARVHTGDKPYVCPCCKKGFARSDALKRHFQIESKCSKSEQVIAFEKLGKRRYKSN